jgi:tagatose 6-phosphate kinase
MILCIGVTPAAQRVMFFRQLVPDAVNRAVTTLDGVAGKSVNVAKVLQALGENPVALGFAGGDRGEEICRELSRKGVTTHYVRTGERTRQCITVIDESASAITELVEESRAVDPAHYETLFELAQQQVAGSTGLILSGTITPRGPTDFYARCVELAHRHRIPAIVDAQGVVLIEALKARPGLVKPNRAELAATVGTPLRDEATVIAAMQELHQRGAERVVVTAGKEATLAYDGARCWRITPPKIKAVNPIGSGDSFTAGLAWRLFAGAELGESCRWGAAAGAANALTLMAGELEKQEVERLAALVTVDKL